MTDVLDALDPSFGLTLWHVLALALAICAITLRKDKGIVAAALLLNWALCHFVAHPPTNGIPDWGTRAMFDMAAGAAILWIADSRFALAIGGLYIVELFAHLAFGVIVSANTLANAGYTPSFDVQVAYWEATHWSAWLQVWLLLAWMSRDAIRVFNAWLDLHRDRRDVRQAYSQMDSHGAGWLGHSHKETIEARRVGQ